MALELHLVGYRLPLAQQGHDAMEHALVVRLLGVDGANFLPLQGARRPGAQLVHAPVAAHHALALDQHHAGAGSVKDRHLLGIGQLQCLGGMGQISGAFLNQLFQVRAVAFQLAVDAPDFGHVGLDRQVMRDFAIGLAHRRHDGLLFVERAILALVEQGAAPGLALGQCAPHGLVGLGRRASRLQQAGVALQHFFGGVAGGARERRVHVLNVPLPIGDDDALRALLDRQGELAQLVFHLLALGDVLLHGDIANGALRGVAQRRDDGALGAFAAVLGAIDELAAPLLPGGQAAPHFLVGLGRRLARAEQARIDTQHLLAAVAGGTDKGIVDKGDAAVQVGDDHRVRALLHRHAELAQFLLGALLLRDVLPQ